MSADEIDPLAGPAAADAADGPHAIARASATEASDPVRDTQAIAEGLASGALDPVAAQQLLIDQVLAEQLPTGIAPDQLERIRGELANLLAGDPTLAALLR